MSTPPRRPGPGRPYLGHIRASVYLRRDQLDVIAAACAALRLDRSAYLRLWLDSADPPGAEDAVAAVGDSLSQNTVRDIVGTDY